MEIILLAITIVSLLVAFLMSAAAWRVAREERARSAARVASLAAAATQLPPRPQPLIDSRDPVAVETQFAARREQLAAWKPERRPVPERHVFAEPPRSATAAEADLPLNGPFLGSAVAQPPSGGRQRALAIAAGLLCVALVAGGYFTLVGGSSATVSAAASTPASAAPLELMSLRHDRRGAKLAITGLVRNPSSGAQVENLAAMVFLFDKDGGFITSSRADVDFTKLGAGDESPFVISLDAPDNVARYRVSFRNDAGVVAHVDRRGQAPIAKELP